jgi:hypothetical protein
MLLRGGRTTPQEENVTHSSTHDYGPSASHHARLPLPLLGLIGFAATVSLLGAYWDLAWHTDVGRDTFFSPPHIVLYAGVALLLGAVLAWTLGVWRRGGSWRDLLTRPDLMLTLVGAGLAAAAAPVDDFWHHAFGRDSVIWSPPHTVAIIGLVAFAAGVLHGVGRATGRIGDLARAVAGGFLLIGVMFLVVEYETDVPQFSLVWYLPVVSALAAFAFPLLARGRRDPWAATKAALAFTALRTLVFAMLAVSDHALAMVPPLFGVALAFDLARRWHLTSAGVGAAVAATTFVAYPLVHSLSPGGLVFQPSDVWLGLPFGWLVSWGSIAATERVRRKRRLPLAAALVALVPLLGTASAHDPGQGLEVAPVALAATTTPTAITLQVTVLDEATCARIEPRRVVARRAGDVVAAPLGRLADCRFEGVVEVPTHQRWFVYAEAVHATEAVEAWLPVGGSIVSRPPERLTELYLALPEQTGIDLLQFVAGALLYLIDVGVLILVVRAFRSPPPQADRASAT